MSNTIQTQPLGLLSALGVQTGRAPSQLSDQVVPTIDMLPFWMTTLQAGTVVDRLLVTTVGEAAEIIVPNGEVWNLKATGFIAHTPSAPIAAVRIRLSVIIDPANTPIMESVNGSFAAVTDQFSGGLPLPQPFFLAPRDRIVATLENEVGAPTFTLSLRAVFARFRT